MSAYTATNAFRMMFETFSESYRHIELLPLRGRDLACWCPLPCRIGVALDGVAYDDLYEPCAKPRDHDGEHDPSVALWCHADVLLELANQ